MSKTAAYIRLALRKARAKKAQLVKEKNIVKITAIQMSIGQLEMQLRREG